MEPPAGKLRSLHLAVVNDAPSKLRRTVAQERKAPEKKARRLAIDQRFIDLAAVLFSIALAVILAHVFASLETADRNLLCFLAGGTVCR